jgi:hypothetical protein
MMITPNKEEIMVWFTVGLMVGGFLGMLLMAIFVSNKRGERI